MKKLNQTEIKAVALKISEDIINERKTQLIKILESKTLQNKIKKIIKKDALFKLVSSSSESDLKLLEQALSPSLTSLENLRNIDSKLFEDCTRLIFKDISYDIPCFRYLNIDTRSKINDIIDSNTHHITNCRIVRGIDYSGKISENSSVFTDLKNDLILAQVESKDLKSLINTITKKYI